MPSSVSLPKPVTAGSDPPDRRSRSSGMHLAPHHRSSIATPPLAGVAAEAVAAHPVEHEQPTSPGHQAAVTTYPRRCGAWSQVRHPPLASRRTSAAASATAVGQSSTRIRIPPTASIRVPNPRRSPPTRCLGSRPPCNRRTPGPCPSRRTVPAVGRSRAARAPGVAPGTDTVVLQFLDHGPAEAGAFLASFAELVSEGLAGVGLRCGGLPRVERCSHAARAQLPIPTVAETVRAPHRSGSRAVNTCCGGLWGAVAYPRVNLR